MKAYRFVAILSLAMAGVSVTHGNKVWVDEPFKRRLFSAALAQGRLHLESPIWSRDATQIAFAMSPTGGPNDWNIYVANSDGSKQRQLTRAGAWDAAWSPDGSAIAFVSRVDGKRQIFVMAPDGSGAHGLTRNEDEHFHPAWSAKGDQLAFVCRTNAANRICVMNASGSSQRVLTPADQQCRWPAWSPDGRRIAYNVQGEIWMIDTATNERVRLVESQTATTTIDWSPDGRQLLFAAGAGEQSRIEALDVSSGQTRRILGGDWQPEEPRWSPDGKRVLFLSRGAKSGIYWLEVSESSVFRVLTDGTTFKRLLAHPILAALRCQRIAGWNS